VGVEANIAQIDMPESGQAGQAGAVVESSQAAAVLAKPSPEREKPPELHGRIRSSGIAQATARKHPQVTVVFIDIVGFSAMCNSTSPLAVLNFLEKYFEVVDQAADEFGVTKVRTVGDGYLAVTGLMAEMGVKEDCHQHVLRTFLFGVMLLSKLRDMRMRMPDGTDVECRIGFAHGPVFSGVLGSSFMQFDIFGDIANLAARMEQTSPVGGLHMPEQTFDLMLVSTSLEQRTSLESLTFDKHAGVALKNMGSMDTVSLTIAKQNSEIVDKVLVGWLTDDSQRSVAIHIGVSSESIKHDDWSTATAQS
jgi:class 3 adenylate cyclase